MSDELLCNTYAKYNSIVYFPLTHILLRRNQYLKMHIYIIHILNNYAHDVNDII